MVYWLWVVPGARLVAPQSHSKQAAHHTFSFSPCCSLAASALELAWTHLSKAMPTVTHSAQLSKTAPDADAVKRDGTRVSSA